MKKIVCDLCESTEFTKEGGFFICQGCGTKYSLEEAKSMMREVEGGATSVSSVPVNAVHMGNPNQQQIDNLLVLATSSKEAGNNEDCEKYCNQAIILDATCYKAWLLKGKAIGWSSKLDNNRMEEAAHSFCQAIDFAPEDEKDDLKTQAVEELKKLGLACISLRKDNFAKDPSDSNLNGFNNDRLVLIKAITVLLAHGNTVVGMPEGYTEEIANMMNQSAVAALNMVRNVWNSIEHPSDNDLSTYMDMIGNIANLICQSIDASEDDDEEDIVRYKNLAIVIEEPIGKHSDKREWSSFSSSYYWTPSRGLTDEACNGLRKKAQDARDKAEKLEKKVADKKVAEARKAEEEKQSRIKAYWEAHADEKAALDAELKDLEAKKESLSAEISDIDDEIIALNLKGTVPSEEEDNNLRDQINNLCDQRSKLGIFAGKEKKRISEEIASLNGRRDSLKPKIEDEKKARQAEADKKMAPLQEKRAELQIQLDAATKRINAIVNELTKDPEA